MRDETIIKICNLCDKYFSQAGISYEEWLDGLEKVLQEEIYRRVCEELKWREGLGQS